MTTALVLIDLQNDYFPGGAMELVDAVPAVNKAAQLLEAFRARGLPVIHVRHISTRPGATFFLPGTAGSEIHEAVKPVGDEPVVIKHFPNSFRETTLLDTLRALNVRSLVFAGMMTHMCVDTSVRAAADLGFSCALAQDGCATRNLQFDGQAVDAGNAQRAYLAGLSSAFATVGPAAELCAGLDAAP